jgi:hypothetical protein
MQPFGRDELWLISPFCEKNQPEIKPLDEQELIPTGTGGMSNTIVNRDTMPAC